MGTHMWTNGASRRGRRMSLEIPSISINCKDSSSQSDLFNRRTDFFYPYLPTPFLNGNVHQKVILRINLKKNQIIKNCKIFFYYIFVFIVNRNVQHAKYR